MRRLILLIALQALSVVTCSAESEPLADRVVKLFKDACVTPSTPEQMIEAGNKLASANGWKQVGSGPAPLPMMHNENGPKISYASSWEIDFPEGLTAHLIMSIVRPEIPGVNHRVCIVQPATDAAGEGLPHAVERQFEPALTKKPARQDADYETWFFAQEKAAGNCGKEITILHHRSSSRGTPKTLLFVDLAYPNDGNWVGALAGTKCRS